jgi:hypothetical protein
MFNGLRKFRKLKLGLHLKIFTDHKPAVNVFHSPHDTPDLMISRRMQEISSYNVEISYIPGESNAIADYFSRLLRLSSEEDEEKTKKILMMKICGRMQRTSITIWYLLCKFNLHL